MEASNIIEDLSQLHVQSRGLALVRCAHEVVSERLCVALKVIGAGFGRTGTASLKAALEELGFDKCYHMTEVFPHPEHVPVWQAAAEGKPVDWDKLFEGYQAMVDWPGCAFYKELMQHYPDAKVILSVRDPEAWYKSATDTIYSMSRRGSPMSLVPLFIPNLRRFVRMVSTIIWRDTFDNRFEDRAYALSVFNDHIAEVERTVPPEKLLVYEVKEGWEPLCTFLEVSVPNKPFPRLNDSATFRRQAGWRLFRRNRSKA